MNAGAVTPAGSGGIGNDVAAMLRPNGIMTDAMATTCAAGTNSEAAVTPSTAEIGCDDRKHRGDGRRAVLLGVGNILLNDEGVGVRAVECYVASHGLPDGVVALDGGTSAMEMLEDLENLDLLVVVDCVRVGQPPASVVVLTGDEVPTFFRQRLSPHQVGLSDVFATLLLTGRAPRELVVIGVQPVDISVDMRLTPAVEACVPRVLDEIHAVFERHGYVSPRDPIDPATTVAVAAAPASTEGEGAQAGVYA